MTFPRLHPDREYARFGPRHLAIEEMRRSFYRTSRPHPFHSSRARARRGWSTTAHWSTYETDHMGYVG